MTRAKQNDGPEWIPDLHAELSRYVESLGVPKDESCGIADEAIAVTLVKLHNDPSMHSPKPSEEIRKLSFGVAYKLAMESLRRAARGGTAVPIRTETSDDVQDIGSDVPATAAPVGHDFEMKDQTTPSAAKTRGRSGEVLRRNSRPLSPAVFTWSNSRLRRAYNDA